jgi:hypothetical protein
MAKSTKPLPATPPMPRANSHEVPREKAHFLDGTPAAKSNPQGSAGVQVGPGTKVWHATERAGARK